MYKQGLKENVRAELMRTSAQTDTLDKLIAESVRLDNELYELAMEGRAERVFHNPPRRFPNEGRHRQRQNPTTGVYRTYGPEPMHLDNTMVGAPKKWNKESKYS